AGRTKVPTCADIPVTGRDAGAGASGDDCAATIGGGCIGAWLGGGWRPNKRVAQGNDVLLIRCSGAQGANSDVERTVLEDDVVVQGRHREIPAGPVKRKARVAYGAE